MPEYLLSKNQLFDRMIEHTIDIPSLIDMDDLREIAFYLHQMLHFTKLHDLWSTYLRAGIGLLKEEHDVSQQIDRRYWSQDVQILFQQTKSDVDLVYQQLHDYDQKIKMYELLYNEKKHTVEHWSTTIQQAIQTFVHQHGIRPVELQCNYKMAILGYEYEDHLLQCQYEQQQQPTDYQVS